MAAKQHGIVSRRQLLERGFAPQAIHHRLSRRRLHPVFLGRHRLRGVYAVGRSELTRKGHWIAAVLACGDEAELSFASAAALWGMRAEHPGPIHVSVPARACRRRPGIVVHRRATVRAAATAIEDGIPVTSPIDTLIDLATFLDRGGLEAAINEGNKRELVEPEALRSTIARMRNRRGTPFLRQTLDRRTFTLTDSALERLFLPIARRAGLPLPNTGVRLNGFKVDFYWPDLGLVVETDGLRYHRTPAQQARDRLRDQAHAAAGLTTLRFTPAQIRYEPEHVVRTLEAVVRRLRAEQARS